MTIERTRAPYWHLLVPHVILNHLTYFPETDVYSVNTDFSVLMSFYEKREGSLKLVEEIVKFRPGMVVNRKRRPANQVEIGKYGSLDEQKLEKLSMEKIDGKLFVLIGERIESLWHAGRQLARHAISTYLGKEIKINKEAVLLLGSYQRMNLLSTKISQINASLTEILAKAAFPEKELLSQRAKKRILAISNFVNTFLSTKRTAEVKAQWERTLEEEKLTRFTYQLAKAGVEALEKAALDLEIVAKLAKKAQKRIELDESYKEILKEIYQSLGKIAKELQDMLSEGKFSKEKLEKIDEKVRELLEKASEIKFDPYSNEAILTKEFQGLSRVSGHIGKGEIKTAFNLCQKALKKIEKFVLGEVPKPEELKELRSEAE